MSKSNWEKEFNKFMLNKRIHHFEIDCCFNDAIMQGNLKRFISKQISLAVKEAKRDIEWQKKIAHDEGYAECLRLHKLIKPRGNLVDNPISSCCNSTLTRVDNKLYCSTCMEEIDV